MLPLSFMPKNKKLRIFQRSTSLQNHKNTIQHVIIHIPARPNPLPPLFTFLLLIYFCFFISVSMACKRSSIGGWVYVMAE